MIKRFVSGFMLTLLITSMLALMFNVQPIRSEWTRTVYIRADGSIDPPDAPLSTSDNVTYTLTGNITSEADGIVVERSNVIINGVSYTIEGTITYKNKGIFLSNINNVTIKNINIKSFYYGIYLNYSSNNNIHWNNITQTECGIALLFSSENAIFKNNITDNIQGGIGLRSSSSNTIFENSVDGIGLSFDSSNNSICTNNIISTHVDAICLAYDSSNNIISGNTIRTSLVGIYLWDSSKNNIISENDITANNDDGIILFFNCSNNILYGNNITNSRNGIVLGWSSNNNTIYKNNITNNNGNGISFSDPPSNYNNIHGNNIANNKGGISIAASYNNLITGNNITDNFDYGLSLEASSNNTICGNNIAKNGQGITLGLSYNNIIFHNNFVDNAMQVYDLAWDNPPLYPSINIWDDGYPSGGNYWSDYKGVDLCSGPLQNVTGSDGIGDTPYIIDENNIDRYPLMNPWGAGTPIANFNWIPLIPELGELVTFDASASMPAGGEIVSYQWDFGDGNYASGKIVTHQYSSTGNYTVTLNLTDSEGLWDSEQKQIQVKAPPPPLTVSISPTSASMLVGQSLTFTSTVSGGYTPYSYQWFLNGNPVSGATSPSWAFTPTTSGIFYVYLKVTDAKGNTAQSEAAHIVVSTVPVGGYSIPIQLPTTAKPVTIHITLLTILTALFITIKQKTRRKHR